MKKVNIATLARREDIVKHTHTPRLPTITIRCRYIWGAYRDVIAVKRLAAAVVRQTYISISLHALSR